MLVLVISLVIVSENGCEACSRKRGEGGGGRGGGGGEAGENECAEMMPGDNADDEDLRNNI